MKLLLPFLSEIGVETGFAIRNPLKLRSLKNEPQVLIQLWKNFDLIAKQKISFQGHDVLRLFLSDVFKQTELDQAAIASVELDPETFSPEDQKEFFKNSFEGQCLFRDLKTQKWTGLLYDFIPDKKPNHVYAPILHCAHSAYVSQTDESYAVLVNFRPTYLKSDKQFQSMNVQLKSPQGDLLLEKKIQFPFNSSYLMSFKNEFAALGGFKPGSTINFKGGESQFAIFTLFQNKETGSLGIEHSLAPHYYCSGVAQPESRKLFYKNAFSDIKGSL